MTETTAPRPPLYSDELREGTEIPPLEKRPTTVTLFRYSAITWNPHRIHYDKEYAATEGHPDVLVHGHLHGAYLVQMLMDWIGPQGVLKKFGWSNRRPGFAGDTLTCRGRVTRAYEENGEQLFDCEIWEENQRGEVCAPGNATVSLPRRP